MKDIVFYSKHKRDIHSPKLLQMIKTMPFAKNFSYFCIDKDPLTQKANQDVLYLFEIEEVPTMYVQGKKYKGIEAFEWLEQVYNELHSRQQQKQEQSNYQQAPPLRTPQHAEQPLPQVNDESFGGLDTFSGGGGDYANLSDSTTISGEKFTKDDLHATETKSSTSERLSDMLQEYEANYNSDLNPIGMQRPNKGFAGGR